MKRFAANLWSKQKMIKSLGQKCRDCGRKTIPAKQVELHAQKEKEQEIETQEIETEKEQEREKDPEEDVIESDESGLETDHEELEDISSVEEEEL